MFKKLLIAFGAIGALTGVAFSQTPIDQLWKKSGVKLNAAKGVTTLCLSNGTTCFNIATAFTSPMSALGDIITGGTSGAPARLAGNTTNFPMSLLSIGSGSSATAPFWGEIPFLNGIDTRTVGANNPLPQNITSTTFTLNGSVVPVVYYSMGKKVTVNTSITATLTDGTAGLYYVCFNGGTGTITATKTFCGIDNTSNPIVASVIWNGSNYGLVVDERHSASRNKEWHYWAHTTVGTRYVSGLTLTHNGGTGAAATFATTSGAIADEDINFAISASSAFPTANTARILYQSAASTYSFLSTPSTSPFHRGANNRPNYVKASDSSLVEMTSAQNRYINAFVYATPDNNTPIYIVTEPVSDAVASNNGHTSVSNARAIPFPNLSSFGLSPEMKPIYRIIIRADGVVQALDTTLDDYRTVSSLPMSAGTVSTNASAVSFLASGTLTSTNVQNAIEELNTKPLTRCRAKIDLAAADDSISMGYFTGAVTITGVSASFLGTGTTPATIALKDGAGNAMTHNTVTAATQAAAVTFVAVTANNTLTAGETLMFDTTNTPNPTTDDYVICVTYTQ